MMNKIDCRIIYYGYGRIRTLCRCNFWFFLTQIVDWYEWKRMGFGLLRILQVAGHFWCFAYETVPYAYGMSLIRVWGTLPRGCTRMIRSCPVPNTTYWCFAYESVWGCSYAYGILERGKLFW